MLRAHCQHACPQSDVPQTPASHPPVSVASVVDGSVSLLVDVAVVADVVPLSAVPGPALVSATVAEDGPPFDVPDVSEEPPVFEVSVGEKHAAPRLVASTSLIAVRDQAPVPGSVAPLATPAFLPRPTSVVRMLPNE